MLRQIKIDDNQKCMQKCVDVPSYKFLEACTFDNQETEHIWPSFPIIKMHFLNATESIGYSQNLKSIVIPTPNTGLSL